MGRWAQARKRGSDRAGAAALAPPTDPENFEISSVDSGVVQVDAASTFPDPAAFLEVWIKPEGGIFDSPFNLGPLDSNSEGGLVGGSTASVKCKWLNVEEEPITDFGPTYLIVVTE